VQTWSFGPGPTLARLWEFLIALPLLNYTWLRYVWKIGLWIYYLAAVSHTPLDLHATHVDMTGGIGFVSYTQRKFAILILAYGISNVAATVGYEIAILNYELSTPPVWGPVLGFVIGAPLLFTLPLFMFTRQLYRSKHRALIVYRQRVTEHSRRVENLSQIDQGAECFWSATEWPTAATETKRRQKDCADFRCDSNSADISAAAECRC
jgi:hypothetical protein